MKSFIHLYLSSREMAAWRPTTQTGWQLLANFKNSGEGLADFRHFLDVHRKCGFVLLIDHPEEKVYLSELPGIRGKDLAAYCERQRQQNFSGHRLSCAQFISRHGKQALRLHGFGDESAIAPWLEAICTSQTCLHAVLGTAQLAPELGQFYSPASSDYLLARLHDDVFSAWFVQGRQTHYVRHCELDAGSAQDSAQQCTEELARVRRYLAASGFTEHPQLICIADAGLLADLQAELPPTSLLIAEQSPHRNGAPLLLTLVKKSHFAHQLGDRELLAAKHVQRETRQLVSAMLLATLLALGTSSYGHYQVLGLVEATQAYAQEARTLRSLSGNESALIEALAQDDLLSLHRDYRKLPGHAPANALRQLASVLDRFSDIQLISMDWEIAPVETSTAEMPAKANENLRLQLTTSNGSTLPPDFLPALEKHFELVAIQGDAMAQIRLRSTQHASSAQE